MSVKKLKVVAIVSGAVILVTSATTAIFGNKLEKRYIQHKIKKEGASYSDVLDAVAEKTTIDDILRPTSYKEILNNYHQFREAEDYENARKYLAALTHLTLEASICEYEGIEMCNVREFESWLDVKKNDGEVGISAKCSITYDKEETEQLAGNVVINKVVEVSTTYNLEGQLFDMAYNIAMLKHLIVAGSQENLTEEDKLDQLDDAYLDLESFLATTEIKHALFDEETLKNSYSLKKGFKI